MVAESPVAAQAGSRAIAADSDHDAARLVFQSASVLPSMRYLAVTDSLRLVRTENQLWRSLPAK
jgi:hypothetical protein